MATTLPIDMEAPLALNPKDAEGNVANVENLRGESNSTACQVFIVDGVPVVVPGSVAGETVQITIKADVRIGEGDNDRMEMLEFTLVAAEAVSLGLSVGSLRPKTAH